MKYFLLRNPTTAIRFGPSQTQTRIRNYARTIQQEPSKEFGIVPLKEETFITNEEIKHGLNGLPKKSKRLDQNEIERNSPEELFLSSLGQNGARRHRRVGSTYDRARSPVYFPNIDMQLVRPSPTDQGDPYTAIFRCDLRLTKPDIFNYLRQIYGIGITSIRTAIYRNRNRRRLKSKVRGGVVVDNKRGDRTFKKVWIGLDKPFFFPPSPKSRFLSENFNFNDLLNTFNRFKLIQAEKSKTDPNQVLPAGFNEKGKRNNVFRNLLELKQNIHPELKNYVKKSLTSFTPSDVVVVDRDPADSTAIPKPKN